MYISFWVELTSLLYCIFQSTNTIFTSIYIVFNFPYEYFVVKMQKNHIKCFYFIRFILELLLMSTRVVVNDVSFLVSVFNCTLLTYRNTFYLNLFLHIILLCYNLINSFINSRRCFVDSLGFFTQKIV